MRHYLQQPPQVHLHPWPLSLLHLVAVLYEPPKDMEITDGLLEFFAASTAWLIPSIITLPGGRTSTTEDPYAVYSGFLGHS